MLWRRQFLQGSALAAVALTLPTVAQAQAAVYCPILMYHYIAEPPADADRTLRDLCVTPQLFDEHLARLQADGFATITAQTLAEALLSSTALPPKPVVLSFDDGHDNAYGAAFPLLMARGMVGSFYIITGAMEAPRYLTWGQAAEMWNVGMEIGNHSASHASLRGLKPERLPAETQGAADTIEAVLGRRPVTYCYPFGHFDDAARRAVRKSGHLAALTTQDGTLHRASDLYRLRRVRVRHTTTPDQLAWAVSRWV
ncbi:MAG: polysaccharide deacetylase family protein [Anaerolineae bacterium]|nr:polysaccharide deacetylase family protein [Anaerolineae bacterium]MDW8171117.1 polysaccharide deacetylase family protein [Anaerolineae bacterium]